MKNPHILCIVYTDSSMSLFTIQGWMFTEYLHRYLEIYFDILFDIQILDIYFINVLSVLSIKFKNCYFYLFYENWIFVASIFGQELSKRCQNNFKKSFVK